MACPLVEGKGYFFSDPIVQRGNVGTSVETTLEFTIFPQEGFFLRADRFFINSGSELISQAQFIQNNNNVDVVATLNIELWPDENTEIDIDVEYLYIDGSGLDPIVRAQNVTIMPVDIPGVRTRLDDGTFVPDSGSLIPVVGTCGEIVPIPTVTLIPDDGLTIDGGYDSIDLITDNDQISIDEVDQNTDDLGFSFDISYAFSEDDTETPGDITLTPTLSEEDVVSDDLITPDPVSIGLGVSFREERQNLLGGNIIADVTGVPNTEIDWTLRDEDGMALSGDCELPTTNVPGIDADGCAIDVAQNQAVDGSVLLDSSGNGTIEFISNQSTSGNCCYLLTVEDSTNNLGPVSEKLNQSSTTKFEICLEARTEGNENFSDLPQVVYTSELEPGMPMVEFDATTTTNPRPTQQWLLDSPTVDPASVACWIDGHPADFFDCFNVEASLDSSNLVLDWLLKDGIQPGEDVKIILDLDCFANDPPIPGTNIPNVTVTFCVDVTDNSGVTTTTLPISITGQPSDTIESQTLEFVTSITNEDYTLENFNTSSVTPVTTISVGVEDFTSDPFLSLNEDLTLVVPVSGSFPAENVKVTFSYTITPEEVVIEEVAIPILGCTDPTAENYNPDATEDDGSCTYTSIAEPEFTTIVRIENQVENTTLTSDDTFMFGPNESGTLYSGDISLQSSQGYEDGIGLVGTASSISGLFTELTADGFSIAQRVGDQDVTITLTGSGPTIIPLPEFTCAEAMFTATVDDDGDVSGQVETGTLVSISPETVELDSGNNTITATITIPEGFEGEGNTMECSTTVVAPEAPPEPEPEIEYSQFFTTFTITDEAQIPGLLVGGFMDSRGGSNRIGGSEVIPGDSVFISPFGVENRNVNDTPQNLFDTFYSFLGGTVSNRRQQNFQWGGQLGFGFNLKFLVPDGINIPSSASYPELVTALGLTGIQVRPTTPGTNIYWDYPENTFGQFNETTRELQIVFNDFKDIDGNPIPFGTLQTTPIGEYLNLGENRWEIVLQGINPTIPSYVRAYSFETNNSIDPTPILKMYRQEVVDTLTDDNLNIDDYLITEVDFNGPLEDDNDYLFNEGDVSSNIIFATINTDNYLDGAHAADFLTLTAKDQDGNVISSSNDDLAVDFYPDFSALNAKLTGNTAFNQSQRVVAFRWKNVNTVGVSKIYWDISIAVDRLSVIPSQASIVFNFTANDDGVFQPYNIVTGDVDETQSISISGLSGLPTPAPPSGLMWYGIPNDSNDVYGPNNWFPSIEAPTEKQYWEDLGYTIDPLILDGLFADYINYTVEFESYVDSDGNVLDVEDPYPNIGFGMVFDHEAMTITRRTGLVFRANYGGVGNLIGGVLSVINRCQGTSQYINMFLTAISGGQLFDSRGGTATYNVSATPVITPPAIELGTILYTDESSDWQGNTIDNTTVNIESYDWGTQEIQTPLDQITVVVTSDRSYPAVTTESDWEFSIVERSYTDLCLQSTVEASDSDITITPAFESRNTIYGDRGQVTLTIAGMTDVQKNNRNVMLDLNISGTNEQLEEATFSVSLVDNMNNNSVSSPASYTGYETELYPENLPLQVIATPDSGYAFTEASIESITIHSSNGPNSGLFSNSGISSIADSLDVIDGQLVVSIQPDSTTALDAGHTVIELIVTGPSNRDITLGPPYEDEGVFSKSSGVTFGPTTELPLHTVTPTTGTILEFNTADQDSENNLEYRITITPPANQTYSIDNSGNPFSITPSDINVYSVDDSSVEFTDYVISNVSLGSDNTSVEFDFKFTFDSIPTADPCPIFFDIPDNFLTASGVVSVVLEITSTVSDEIQEPYTVTMGGMVQGDRIEATYTLIPTLHHTINHADITITPDQSEISFDSTLIVSAPSIVDTNGQLGDSVSYTFTYYVSTDDFTAIDALSDDTYNIPIVLSGAAAAYQSTLEFRAAEYDGTTLTDPGTTQTVDSGTGIGAVTSYGPSWEIDAGNSLHWYRSEAALSNILSARLVSGVAVPGIDISLASTSGGINHKTMTGNVSVSAGALIPEGHHIYEVYLNDNPADDTITRITGIPSSVPHGGGDYTICIENETGSGVDVSSIVVSSDHSETATATANAEGDVNCFDIIIPATAIIDEDDTPTWSFDVDTNFGSPGDGDFPKQIQRPRDFLGTAQTVFTVTYNVDVPNTSVYTSNTSFNDRTVTPTNATTIGGGNLTQLQVSYTEYPGGLFDEISGTVSGSTLIFRPSSPFRRFSGQPESAGEITYNSVSAVQRSDINGRLRWQIPNTAGRLGTPAFRGELHQDGFDGLLASNGNVSNTHIYDYHPKANTDIVINVSGTGPTILPSMYDCNDLFRFELPAPDATMTYTMVPIDITDLFANTTDNTLVQGSDETTEDPLDVNTNPWFAACEVQGRIQENQSYRFQLLYGDTDGNGQLANLGVFTDSGWVGTFFGGTDTPQVYGGISVTTSGQEIWDLPGWYGYQSGSGTINTYLADPNTGSVGNPTPATFDPNIMAGSRDGIFNPRKGNGNNDAESHLVGLGNFVDLASINNRFIATAFNLPEAIDWYTGYTGNALAPRFFFLRIMGGRSRDGVDGQGQLYPLDMRIRSRCFQHNASSSFVNSPLGPTASFNDTNNELINRNDGAVSRDDIVWTVDRDTTFL